MTMSGKCQYCEAFIGVAVKAHEAGCELRPQDVATQRHDPEAAERGECQCPTCWAERLAPP